jgi:hypothetical protein
MLELEHLHVMPQMTRVESEIEGGGGYEYPERFHNKVFLFNETVVLFEKRKFHEYPVALIHALTEALSQHFVSEDSFKVLQDTILEVVETKFEDIENKLERIEESSSNGYELKIKEIRNGLVSLEKNSHQRLDELSSVIANLAESIGDDTLNIGQLTSDTKKYTEDLVGKELEILYKNFEKGIANLVKESVEKIRADITKSENKIKPTQLMMYKEMGIDTDEVIKLKTAGLL